jgi:hypothetical protein
MANPIGLNGTHYRQERYADSIVKLFRKQLVVRSEFARDYEGNPVAGAVQVPVRATDVALANYDVASGVSLTTSATTYLNIPVNNHKAINELVDGYEANAVPDSLVAQRLESGAYQIGLTLELNAIGELEDNGTEETSTTALTTSTAYAAIATSVKDIKKLGVDINDIVVIVSPETELLLITDEKFSNTAGMLGAELVREGVIGKIAGARVKMSANLSSDVEYIAFAKPWAQAIDEWKVEPRLEDLKDGAHIGASALQGRMVYADKLTEETACRVKKVVAASV